MTEQLYRPFATKPDAEHCLDPQPLYSENIDEQVALRNHIQGRKF